MPLPHHVFNEQCVTSLLGIFFIIFFDDILVYSKTEEEHEKHLVIVLQLLREHKLYAMLNKCDLFQSLIYHLGHLSPRRRYLLTWKILGS